LTDNTRVGPAEILDALRLRWRLAALVLVTVLAGVLFYAYTLPNEYTAKAVVSLTPRPSTGVGAGDIAQLGQKYVAYVTAPQTIGQVARGIGLTRGALGNAVGADVATGSVNLTIRVQLRTPATTATAANALAQAVVAFSADDKLLTAQVVSPAIVPASPSKPRRKLIAGAGGLVALILATAVALLVERGRPRVRSSVEIATVTGHNVLGRVPLSRSVRRGIAAALDDPLVGGAIRSLRTVLDHQAREAAVRTLAVTSSVPGEGKSTVAASLAWSIAHLDARVLLIDADLRHPSLARVLGLPPKPGLVEVLRGEVPLAQAVTEAAGPPGLSVLPTSGIAETGDLLARNLHGLLSEAAGSYDVVIVDTPPLLAGDDSTTMATMCDAVLLVVTSGQQIRRLGDAARALSAIQARVLGVLLNRADVPSYGYTYRTLARSVDAPLAATPDDIAFSEPLDSPEFPEFFAAPEFSEAPGAPGAPEAPDVAEAPDIADVAAPAAPAAPAANVTVVRAPPSDGGDARFRPAAPSDLVPGGLDRPNE
jgi:succinoglycan biosynthesis transport protein ExoP